MPQFLKDIAARTAAQVVAPYVIPVAIAAIAAVPKSESWINAFIPVKWQGRLAAALFALLWVAAFYIFRLRRRLQKRFLDDYEFIPTLGLYKHKSKPGYFCGSCTAKEIESPLQESPQGWRCQINNCVKWHEDPNYKATYTPIRRSSELRPEDY